VNLAGNTQELTQLGGRVVGQQQRLADQEGVETGPLEPGQTLEPVEPTLRHLY